MSYCGAGQRRVGDDVDGERGDVGGPDDAADRERGPQFVAAFLQLVPEQRCRERGVDEASRDEVDADRRELERESADERGQGVGGGGGDPDAASHPPAAGAAHEQQRAPWSHLASGVARDLEPQHDVTAEHLAHLVRVHLEQGSVGRAGPRDHHVVDRSRQILEEPLHRGRVGGVEGRHTLRADLPCRLPEPVGIAAGDDHVGTLGFGAPGRLQPNACASADHDHGLSSQFRRALAGAGSCWARHRPPSLCPAGICAAIGPVGGGMSAIFMRSAVSAAP